MSLIFVDCEGINIIDGQMTEFGAVNYDTCWRYKKFIPEQAKTFHGILKPFDNFYDKRAKAVFEDFRDWLTINPSIIGRPIFVSDNPAYDWQGINYHFLKYIGNNPFGWSARRIGDFYAGLKGDFYTSQKWKKLRKTKHDHHPIHDAMGNVEAFYAMTEEKLL